MPSTTAYLFLELAILVLLLAFCWEQLRLRDLARSSFLRAALCLSVFWLVIDQVALRLQLWTFPERGTLPFRLFGLPLEEYLLFFLHTFVCLVLLKQCAAARG